MTQRVISGSTYNLTYDAENRLTGVSGAATAAFVYDGDGNRVKGTVGGVTTTYIGNYYEWSGSTATSYYYAGSARVAMRQGSTLSYLFADQLGSTSVVANSSGSKTAEVRYKAWGEDRYTSGTVPSGYRFTGQRVDSYINLYWYNSRWYDNSLGRFLSADTIVPSTGDPQAWDRYAYVDNNPAKFVDPTGHCALLEDGSNGLCVRTCSNTQIVRGGLAFLNTTEKALANYILSGNENQMRNIPGDTLPADINRSLANVSSELGLKDDSDSWTNLLLDPNVILLSMALLAPGGINKQPVSHYEVGMSNDLYARSVTGDDLEIHHAPQSASAQQVIPGYDYNNAPAIVLSRNEHIELNPTNVQGLYTNSPRNLMAKTIWDLRNYTNTPNGALWELIDLFDQTFPGVLMK